MTKSDELRLTAARALRIDPERIVFDVQGEDPPKVDSHWRMSLYLWHPQPQILLFTIDGRPAEVSEWLAFLMLHTKSPALSIPQDFESGGRF